MVLLEIILADFMDRLAGMGSGQTAKRRPLARGHNKNTRRARPGAAPTSFIAAQYTPAKMTFK
jgi:hypothetical protein